MNRAHIISEIQRTARANSSVPLGRQRFEKETGIRRHAWFGKYWTRWSDAVREAGFQPNKLQKPHDPLLLIEKLVALTRRLGRAPVLADLLFARNHDPTFPGKDAFVRRLGSRPERAARVLAFCQQMAGYDDVAAIWKPHAIAGLEPSADYGGDPLRASPRGGFPPDAAGAGPPGAGGSPGMAAGDSDPGLPLPGSGGAPLLLSSASGQLEGISQTTPLSSRFGQRGRVSSTSHLSSRFGGRGQG